MPHRAPRTARSCTCRAWPHSTGGQHPERVRFRSGDRQGSPQGRVGSPDDGRPAAPPPRQHPQRAARRGVAVLHEVAADDGLSVGAGPRGTQGARRQQAAPIDGPAHRVLQPKRRNRAGSVRRRRRDAPGCRDLAGPAPRHRHRARSALGRRLRAAWSGTCPRNGTDSVRSSPTWARAIPADRVASTPSGLELRTGDALALLPDDGGRIGRLRRDRPAVQPAAADDDGRRPPGRGAREPSNRLRDDHRVRG